MRIILLVAIAGACGGSKNGSGSDASGGGDAPFVAIDAFAGPFNDFPPTPITDGTAPAGSSGLFGDPASGAATGGPCLIEPEVGTLYPNNWLRPRFTWIAGTGENLFELRLTAGNQVDPLVVYTTNTTWTMPAAIWEGLVVDSVATPITVSVRGGAYDGTNFTADAHGSAGPIEIANAAAPGAIVYWTTSGGTGLKGFSIGDETVHDIVKPADASSQCVGCHSSTPDGTYVGFSSSQDPGNGDPTTLGMLSSDGMKTTPPFITPSAQTLMARVGQEAPAYSKLHWQAGDHTAITMYTVNSKFEIVWTDLEATSTTSGTGVVARTGDANMAASASFAHTTDTILYTSAASVSSGVSTGTGDLYTVPYNARAGGQVSPVMGANTTTYNEYYPTFSPDDKYIAFNRVANGQSSYNNGQAEVFAIPAAGGTPVRLAANDPPMCSGKTSPGVTNSWPKWAPGVTVDGAKSYYWLTFSSTRTGNPQLYVTPVVDDGTSLTTYPALYLWNQPATENNHTPAWDNFSIISITK